MRQEIWNSADKVRITLGIEGPPYEPKEVIKLLGGDYEVIRSYQLRELGLNEYFISSIRIGGCSHNKNAAFTVTINGDKPSSAVRYSVMSDIADILLHCLTKGGNDFIPIEEAHSIYGLSFCIEEANEFAAAFLMPTDEFIRECRRNSELHNGSISIRDIAKKFGVSTNVAMMRGAVLALW